MFKPGEKVINKGHECVVVYELRGVVKIKLPNGVIKPVRADKLKRPEDF